MTQFFEFLKNLKRLGLEFYGRYYAVYPGVVSSIDDPERRGRIRIQLPTLLGNGKDHHAWAEPHYAALAGQNTGEFMVPYVGDFVSVMFENGDVNFPIYCGGTYAREELSADFTANYGMVRGWRFKNGTKILVDEKEGEERILIENNKGTKILIDAQQHVTVMATEVHVDAGDVTVGSGATFSAVLAEKLAELFDKHQHMTPMGPSSPPTPPNTAAQANASSGTAFAAQHVKLKGNG